MRTFLVVLWLAWCSATLFANGSASTEGVPGTGSAAASDKGKKSDVTMESESLKIDLGPEAAVVEVNYVMRNTGPKVDQDFLFPVERWGALPGEESVEPAGLERYQVTVDGRELKSTEVPGKTDPAKAVTVPMWEETFPVISSWKKSVIPFEREQTRHVTIRYSSRYSETDASISEDSHASDATFSYSLSPAATWKGPIGKGKIEINVNHPEPEDVTIESPKDRFKKVSDTRYEWAFEKLKPTLADDIRIIAHSKHDNYPTGYTAEDNRHQAEYVLRANQYFLDHADYDATASSTLPPQGERNYDAVNLKADPQREFQTPWAEGAPGDGVGESITLDVKRVMPLYSLLIRPGYYDFDRTDSWDKNNRLAEAEITLNDEHTFTAQFADQRFNEPTLVRVPAYTKPVKKVKLVVKKVYRGSKHNDTCISELKLRALLSEKPAVNPAR